MVKAVVVAEPGDPDVLAVREVPTPEPGPTEVLVEVHAAGVNPVDVKTRRGGGVSGYFGDTDWILGWDVSGVVAGIGAGVTRFQVGDEVFGMPWFPRPAGAYAEYCVAPSRQLALKPRTIDHAHAAALPLVSLTAWQTLVDTLDVGAGQRVLVHAAGGGVGHVAIQIAHQRGAEVIGTASTPKHDRLRQLGADLLVDYRETDFESEVGEVDVVVDLIGGDVARRSLQVLRPGGRLIVVPSADDRPDQELLDERGVTARWILVEPDYPSLEAIAEMVDTGRLEVDVSVRADLAEAAAVHRALERGDMAGKSVLIVR